MIDPTPESAVLALRSNLLNQVKNGAQALQQNSTRQAVDRTVDNAYSGQDKAYVTTDRAYDPNAPSSTGNEVNTGSGDPYRGNKVNTTA